MNDECVMLLVGKSIGRGNTALYKKSSKFLAERNPYKPTACIQIWCMIRDANLQLVAKVTGNFHSMGEHCYIFLTDQPRSCLTQEEVTNKTNHNSYCIFSI